MSKRSKKRRAPSRGSANWVYLGVALALALVVGLGVLLASPGPPPPGDGSWPDWLSKAHPLVKEAYAYAAEHPETVSYIPCYCGCGQHSGHRSSHDCFVARHSGSSVAYDQHGANCDMCVDAALMTRDLLAQGKSLKEARAAVVKKYGSWGNGTDTPPIPG